MHCPILNAFETLDRLLAMPAADGTIEAVAAMDVLITQLPAVSRAGAYELLHHGFTFSGEEWDGTMAVYHAGVGMVSSMLAGDLPLSSAAVDHWALAVIAHAHMEGAHSPANCARGVADWVAWNEPGMV